MKKFWLIGCMIIFIFCAPKKTTVETEGLEEVIVFGEEEETPGVTEEYVLPPPTEEEALITPPPVEPAEEVTPPVEGEVVILPPPPKEEPLILPPPTTTPSTRPTAPVVPPQKIYGFRIQIFASSTEGNATRVAEDARGVFEERVYVEYSAPYYKVRVGDFLIREDAEVLKNKALRLGYGGAFIVETMISP